MDEKKLATATRIEIRIQADLNLMDEERQDDKKLKLIVRDMVMEINKAIRSLEERGFHEPYLANIDYEIALDNEGEFVWKSNRG